MHVFCVLVVVPVDDVLVVCVESGGHECCDLCSYLLAVVGLFVAEVYGGEVDDCLSV